jgi:hypothetical protein
MTISRRAKKQISPAAPLRPLPGHTASSAKNGPCQRPESSKSDPATPDKRPQRGKVAKMTLFVQIGFRTRQWEFCPPDPKTPLWASTFAIKVTVSVLYWYVNLSAVAVWLLFAWADALPTTGPQAEPLKARSPLKAGGGGPVGPVRGGKNEIFFFAIFSSAPALG